MTMQGALAVVAGFVGMAAIVMTGSAAAGLAMGRSYMTFDFMLGMVAAFAGGAIVAWLAPHAPVGHAWALSGLVLAMSVWCLLSYGDTGPPRWYQAALSMSSALVVLLGARLAQGYL